MTEFKNLTDQVTVSTQMTKEDFAAIAEMGVKTIVCNRVEGEEAGQPLNQTMQDAAADHGMDFIALPMGGEFPLEQAMQMAALLRDKETPIHAYCKSGTRSAILWGLASAMNQSQTPDEIMEITHGAGFDLANVAPAFQQLYEAAKQGNE
jgi:uncharacterized protein (TIGR01244 family)